jgi:hypothetical protein
MMLFQDGKQLWRQSGFYKEEIIKIILDKTKPNEQPNLSKDLILRENWHYNELYLLTNLLF